VGDAFYNGELENEIRILVTTSGTVNLSDFTFRKDSDREAIMEKIEAWQPLHKYVNFAY